VITVAELLGLGQSRTSGNGVPFTYTSPYESNSLDQVTYYLHDHPASWCGAGLGNMRVTYTAGCKQEQGNEPLRELTLEHAADYHPYGSILREWRNGEAEKYLTTHHERDVETGLDYRGARYYDSDVARFLSLDPLANEYAAWSAYSYVLGNPVHFVDPDGRSVDDYRLNKDGSVELVQRTKDSYDRLFFSTEDQSGDHAIGVKIVNDKSVLPQLANGSLTFSTAGQELLDLFKTVADHSDVEWTLAGYRDGQFSLQTKNSWEASPSMAPGCTASDLRFKLHSHPCARELGNRNKYASGTWDRSFSPFNEDSDRSGAFFDHLYRGNSNAQGPRHFLYHPATGSFSEYSAWKRNIPNVRLQNCAQDINTFTQ